jgi:hypothetical protein
MAVSGFLAFLGVASTMRLTSPENAWCFRPAFELI